jgi:oligopeptide transport system substrate-binding protein
MRKKTFAVAMSTVLAAGSIAGCGSAASAPKEAASGAASGQAATTAAAASASTEDWASKIQFTASAKNPAAPDWTEYDKLIDEVNNDADFADRAVKLHKAEDMLMATGAVIPIYYYNDLYLENPAFSGDYASIFGTKYFMYAKKDGQPTDVMKINLASEPDKLDPALNSTVDGAALASNSFVGLYIIDKDGNYQPALADGQPEVSDDELTYTIHMKQDLKWSDGTPLNANDIVYSWKRAADPKTASDYSYLFAVFDGYSEDGSSEINVSAPDDNTVTFKLAAPCPYMMNLLAFPVFMPVPKAAVEAADPDGTNPGAWALEAGFVSNGAFTLKEWKHNESMVYVKNPNYYDADNVSVNELDFMLSADDTAILGAYQAGDIDYADTVPNDEIKNLKSGADFHVVPNLGTYYVGFNVNSKIFDGKTPQQAADMRRALGLLIDRQYIVDTIGQTDQEVATSFVPTGVSDGNGGKFKTNSDSYKYPVDTGYYQDLSVAGQANVDQAKALLESAGYKFDESGKLSADTPITINYITNKGTGHEAIAQAIQQDLGAIGVTVNISTEDWQTFVNDRKSGNFDVARGGWLGDYDDPITMLSLFTSTSGNNDQQLGK